MRYDQGTQHPRTITIATPYGQVLITDNGRTITFKLFSDLRQSEHNFYLFNYAQNIINQGVDRFNVDHIIIPTANSQVTLKRGKARLDMVYFREGKIYEVELKTAGHLGQDSTRTQLTELSTHCKNLILAVPDFLRDEAEQILSMLNLYHTIKVDTYPLTKEQ